MCRSFVVFVFFYELFLHLFICDLPEGEVSLTRKKTEEVHLDGKLDTEVEHSAKD